MIGPEDFEGLNGPQDAPTDEAQDEIDEQGEAMENASLYSRFDPASPNFCEACCEGDCVEHFAEAVDRAMRSAS